MVYLDITMMVQYTKMNVTHDTWRRINIERKPNETMDEVINRIFSDRERFKKMIMEKGVSVL